MRVNNVFRISRYTVDYHIYPSVYDKVEIIQEIDRVFQTANGDNSQYTYSLRYYSVADTSFIGRGTITYDVVEDV